MLSIEALALIGGSREFPSISDQTVAKYNGPLLDYISPSSRDASGLIYVDRMIIIYKHSLDVFFLQKQEHRRPELC